MKQFFLIDKHELSETFSVSCRVVAAIAPQAHALPEATDLAVISAPITTLHTVYGPNSTM